MDPTHGGPSQGIRQSIPALARLGVQNEVICCDSPTAPWIGRDSFPVRAVGSKGVGFSYSPALKSWLGAHMPRFDAVIVHGLWLWPSLAAHLVHKSLGASAPLLFVMPHGMLDPWFQRDPSRRLKAIRNSCYWWLVERRVVNSASGLLFTCEEELRLARTTFRGYHPRRELNVGYGIAAPPAPTPHMQHALAQKCPSLHDKPFLLFLGRIHPKKGVDLLVDAYLDFLKKQVEPDRIPDLLIAGPGWESDYARGIQNRIGKTPKIHTSGMLEGDSKWGALHGCEAFILPSHQENFGIAVVEALACNKLVLISDKVNIWREIADDSAGLVEPDTLTGTQTLLTAFRDRDAAPSTRFRDCFTKRFCIQSAAQKMRGSLENLLTCP